MQMKKWTVVLAAACAALVLTGCGGQGESARGGSSQLKVAVTFNAIKEFALAVGGSRVQVSTLVPDGTEPHDYEPRAKDLAALAGAQVFVYNGLGMETWVKNAVSAAGGQNLRTVEASRGCKPIAAAEGRGTDPHLWLSLKGAELEAGNIAAAFEKADPAGKSYYQKRCRSFVGQCESLYKEYKAKFGGAGRRDFVTGHAAFAYFCRDFGLTQKSVEDVFAEGEPTAKNLAALVQYCKKNGVKTVFAENLASPKVSRTLAQQVGARVQTIYTIESSEQNLGYLARMKRNLSRVCASLKQP